MPAFCICDSYTSLYPDWSSAGLGNSGLCSYLTRVKLEMLTAVVGSFVPNQVAGNLAAVSGQDCAEEWHSAGIGENSCPAGVGIKLIFYVSNDSSVFVWVVLAACQ